MPWSVASFSFFSDQFMFGEGSDVQDLSPNDFCGQRFDLVRAKVHGDAPSELCAVQDAKGTRDQG